MPPERRREYLVTVLSPLHTRLQQVLSSDVLRANPLHTAVTSGLTRILAVRTAPSTLFPPARIVATTLYAVVSWQAAVATVAVG